MHDLRGRGLLFLTVLVVLVAGCSPNERPPADRWQLDWQVMVDVVPDRAELGDPPSEELCQSTLADIRSRSEELPASPTGSIDELAHEWIAIAEEAFFDCPPEGQEIDSFEDAYEEMQRIEDSVDAALEDAG